MGGGTFVHTFFTVCRSTRPSQVALDRRGRPVLLRMEEEHRLEHLQEPGRLRLGCVRRSLEPATVATTRIANVIHSFSPRQVPIWAKASTFLDISRSAAAPLTSPAMPRSMIVRLFDVTEPEMPDVGRRSRELSRPSSSRSPGSTATSSSTTTGGAHLLRLRRSHRRHGRRALAAARQARGRLDRGDRGRRHACGLPPV